jgi:hypothetical protein
VIINPSTGGTVSVYPPPLDQADVVTAGTVEPKVRAATTAATVVPFVLWLLSAYLFHGEVPLPVQGIVGTLITGGCTFAAGYLARHVDRAPAGP